MNGGSDPTSTTRWRLALGRHIAAGYAADPNARVVMVAGSTGRGTADRWSDIEVDVYYDQPPTEKSRRAAAAASGGTLVSLAEDEDEWEERLDFDGFHAHSSTFLVSTMERYLREVLDECSTDALAQSRIFSVQNSVSVQGGEQAEAWRARAATYPDGLRRAMLTEMLDFGRFRYLGEMLAARDDVVLLSDVFVEVCGRLVCALLGLNRIYLPTPVYARWRLKWMDEMIARLSIAPPELSPRLKRVFRAEPRAGVEALGQLVEEMLGLIERHVPDFDLAPYRAAPDGQRTGWDEPPPSAARALAGERRG